MLTGITNIVRQLTIVYKLYLCLLIEYTENCPHCSALVSDNSSSFNFNFTFLHSKREQYTWFVKGSNLESRMQLPLTCLSMDY